jgi:hypothetical protein
MASGGRSASITARPTISAEAAMPISMPGIGTPTTPSAPLAVEHVHGMRLVESDDIGRPLADVAPERAEAAGMRLEEIAGVAWDRQLAARRRQHGP